jgi:hypothetical protein
MAPKVDRPLDTFVFSHSKVSEGLLAEYVTSGYIKEGKDRATSFETVPTPHPNEVVVFHNLFTAGLCFPLDGAIVSILRNFGMYLHHLTLNAIL